MGIRKAKEKDLEVIEALNYKLFANEYNNFDDTISLDWPKSEFGQNYYKESVSSPVKITLVAEDEGRVVGYLIGSKADTPDYMDQDIKIVELENIYIEEAYRSNGIGRALVNELEKWGLENKRNTLKTTASYENNLSRNFYKKIGAKEVDVTYLKRLS